MNDLTLHFMSDKCLSMFYSFLYSHWFLSLALSARCTRRETVLERKVTVLMNLKIHIITNINSKNLNSFIRVANYRRRSNLQ